MSVLSATELARLIAEKHSMTNKQARDILDTAFTEITDQLARGTDVRLHGFGTFSLKSRAERQGRNPKTGQQIVIPASTAVRFKPATALKSVLGSQEG